MPHFRVDTDRVLEMVEVMRGTNTDIAAELDQLDAQVRRLESLWTGEARDAYSRAQAQWNQQLADMNRVLADAARRSEKVAARYSAARQAVATRWGGA